MKVSVGDAYAAALKSLRGFRWTEYEPFFWILVLQLAFLAVCTQLHHNWAMNLVVPMARLFGGEANIHYPMFFAYVSILLGWLESFGYAVLGSVLIPLSLLRLYFRRDRKQTIGAATRERLVAAAPPTLAAGLLLVGAAWIWQRYPARQLRAWLAGFLPAPAGDTVGWLAVTLGGYAIFALLLYVPVAAVHAPTTPASAFARGVRFGLRAWIPTIAFSVFFGLPPILAQWTLEKQGALLLSRLRPELMLVFLAVYASMTSVATYMAYGAGARLYRTSQGEE